MPSTSGDVIAADDIGGVKFQRIKLTLGADGTNDGDVSSANPVPVRETNKDFATLSINLTGAGQNANFDVRDCNSLIFRPTTAGATGHTAAWYGSYDSTNGIDGTFFQINAKRTDSNITDTATFGTINSTPTYAWKAATAGIKWFRINCGSHTTGTVTWNVQKSLSEIEPVPFSASNVTVGGRVYAEVSQTPFEGAPTHHHAISTAGLNATLLKNAGGNISFISVSNIDTVPVYFKLYNKSSAPVVGTDVPVKVFMIPSGQTLIVNLGFSGARLASGIGYGISLGVANTDITPVLADTVIVGAEFS